MPQAAKWVRIWKGQTRAEHFQGYTEYLHENGVRKISALANNLGVQMFCRLNEGVGEFIVVSFWPSLEAIEIWAGADITRTRFLEKDADFLINLEASAKVEHFEVYATQTLDQSDVELD